MSQKMRYEYCPTCKRGFEYSSEDCVQDEKCSYGSTKYVKCPDCNRIFILEVIEDHYDNMNDYRFYTMLDK